MSNPLNFAHLKKLLKALDKEGTVYHFNVSTDHIGGVVSLELEAGDDEYDALLHLTDDGWSIVRSAMPKFGVVEIEGFRNRYNLQGEDDDIRDLMREIDDGVVYLGV